MSLVEQTFTETSRDPQQLITEPLGDLSLSFGPISELDSERQLPLQLEVNLDNRLNSDGEDVSNLKFEQPANKVQDLSYTSMEGITYHAKNREGAITACPYLGRMALNSPEGVDRILNLVQRGMAMIDSPPNPSAIRKAPISQTRPERPQSSRDHETTVTNQLISGSVIEKLEPNPADQIARYPRPTTDYPETTINERTIQLTQITLDKDKQPPVKVVNETNIAIVNIPKITKSNPETQATTPLFKKRHPSTIKQQKINPKVDRGVNITNQTARRLSLVPAPSPEVVPDIVKERMRNKVQREITSFISKPTSTRVKLESMPAIANLRPNNIPEEVDQKNMSEDVALVSIPALVKQIGEVECFHYASLQFLKLQRYHRLSTVDL